MKEFVVAIGSHHKEVVLRRDQIQYEPRILHQAYMEGYITCEHVEDDYYSIKLTDKGLWSAWAWDPQGRFTVYKL